MTRRTDGGRRWSTLSPDEQRRVVAAARRHIAEKGGLRNIKWAALAKLTNLSDPEALRLRLDPGYREYRNGTRDYPKAGKRHIGGHRSRAGVKSEPKISLAEIAARLAEVPPDTRTITGQLCGDPLPGRSALDRRTT